MQTRNLDLITGRFRARSHCSRPGMTIGLLARIVRAAGNG
jgi:hypothetical protein